MKVCKPLYQDSLVQVANSIRKFLDLPMYHEGSKTIDLWIQNNDLKQVVLFLVDGMGSYQIQSYLDKDSFFNTYNDHAIQSVFPPTTVAATTSIRTGLTPAETKYLGWHQYQKEVDDSVTMFQSRSYHDEEIRYPDHIANKYLYETIVETVNKQGIPAREIFPFWLGNENFTVSDVCTSTLDALAQGNNFVYSYWDGYDSYMHEHGVHNEGAIQVLKDIEKAIATMAKQLPQSCGLIVVADHGHIDIHSESLCDYPALMECFLRKPTLEMRCVNFYLKDACKDVFKERFLTHFDNTFDLYSHDEVIQQKLFGNFQIDSTWEEEIGDFVAIAKSDLILTCGESYEKEFKGHHAGMSEEEMQVPLILYTNKK